MSIYSVLRRCNLLAPLFPPPLLSMREAGLHIRPVAARFARFSTTTGLIRRFSHRICFPPVPFYSTSDSCVFHAGPLGPAAFIVHRMHEALSHKVRTVSVLLLEKSLY